MRFVVVAIALGAASVISRPAFAEPPMWTNAPHHRAGPGSFADLAERARHAVVHVRGEVTEASTSGGGESERGRTSIGTGFIVNREGYVITNEHVVRGVAELRVRLYDGRELSACVAGADLPTDIALLKVVSK